MTVTGAIVVFVLGWWISFFIALPFGVQGQHEEGDIVPGTDEGAPINPMLAKKAIWATAGGLIVTAAAALIVPQLLAD